MNHYYLPTIFAALLIWAVFKFVKFRKERKPVKVIEATGKPFIVPSINPETVNKIAPPEPVNRAQRRRMAKQLLAHHKKFAGKTNRDEIRSGKIIEANEFLKQYFDNGKK
jgi:hypothetical protein